jgi:hypothetical protein
MQAWGNAPGKSLPPKRALNPSAPKLTAWSRKLKSRAHYRITSGSVKRESIIAEKDTEVNRAVSAGEFLSKT